MFDVQKIGRRVSTLRKEQNMTQMELADRMGISFQAVSNWERGNSMPDIAKLGELAQALDVTIDELLGDEKATATVKKVLEPETHAPLNAEEFIEVAPMMKPSQAEKSTQRMDFSGLAWKDILVMAPFLKQKTLDELALKARDNQSVNVKELISLAPFLSRDVIDGLFLSADRKEGSMGQYIGLAPFVSGEALELVVEEMMEAPDFDMHKVVALAPFLKKRTLRKLAAKGVEQSGFKGITPILPFLGKDFLENMFKQSTFFKDEE